MDKIDRGTIDESNQQDEQRESFDALSVVDDDDTSPLRIKSSPLSSDFEVELPSGDGKQIEPSESITICGNPVQATVFGFYLPDFQPQGRITRLNQVAPELQLGTGTNWVGFLNGIASLIKHGLAPCDEGFGSSNYRRRTKFEARCDLGRTSLKFDGKLTWTPRSANTNQIIEELNILLTGGRLNDHAKTVIANVYDGDCLEQIMLGVVTKVVITIVITVDPHRNYSNLQ